MDTILFQKYHGLGNDFIIIDARSGNIPTPPIIKESKFISSLCNRNTGIGADGVIFALDPQSSGDVAMQIFNSDGSEAEMCGNGIRCLVKFIEKNTLCTNIKNIKVETLAGYIETSIEMSENVKVNMGSPNFDPLKIPTSIDHFIKDVPSTQIKYDSRVFDVFAAGMGNPHAVIYLENLDSLPLNKWGSFFENHSLFKAKTNVHFANVKNRRQIDVLVWERGCGPTQACGTGACAVQAVSRKLGISDEVCNVSLPGGDLSIEWPELQGPIFMSGPAEYVFSGSFTC